MQNYVQPGKRVATYNSSSSATISAGNPVVVSAHIRIALANILPLTFGECATEEVFALPAKSSDTWNDGQQLYWDNGNGYLTSTSASNALAGSAVGAKLAGSVIQNVKLIDHDEPAGDVLTVPQAAITALAAQTQDALTVTAMTGVANTSPAAETNTDTLTDSTGGTPATTIVALQAGGTGAAAGGWDTANHRDTFISQVANNFSSLAAEHALQKALNTVLINDAKSFATELNKAKADVAAHAATIAALRTALIAAGVISSS